MSESEQDRIKTDTADFIRDEVCCPRIHGCELGGAEECPAERVRAALQAAESQLSALKVENVGLREGLRKLAVSDQVRHDVAGSLMAREINCYPRELDDAFLAFLDHPSVSALLSPPVGLEIQEDIGPHEPAVLGYRAPSADALPRGEPLDAKDWEVEIRLQGIGILTIGHSHLSGVPDIDRYGDVVRNCADHLRSFIGKEPASGYCDLGDDGCVCFFDVENCDHFIPAGQEVTESADGPAAQARLARAEPILPPTPSEGQGDLDGEGR